MSQIGIYIYEPLVVGRELGMSEWDARNGRDWGLVVPVTASCSLYRDEMVGTLRNDVFTEFKLQLSGPVHCS